MTSSRFSRSLSSSSSISSSSTPSLPLFNVIITPFGTPFLSFLQSDYWNPMRCFSSSPFPFSSSSFASKSFSSSILSNHFVPLNISIHSSFSSTLYPFSSSLFTFQFSPFSTDTSASSSSPSSSSSSSLPQSSPAPSPSSPSFHPSSTTSQPLSSFSSSARYAVKFTCKKCDGITTASFTHQSYHHGVVLIRCSECRKLHLFADNLKWFEDYKINIEDIMREKGEKVTKVQMGGEGITEGNNNIGISTSNNNSSSIRMEGGGTIDESIQLGDRKGNFVVSESDGSVEIISETQQKSKAHDKEEN